MIIDVTALGERQTSIDFLLPSDQIDLADESVKLNDAVKIEGKLTKTSAEINVEGKIFADVELECSRCLQSVQRFLEIPFQTAFVTPENYSTEKEIEVNPRDLEVDVFEGDRIDLNELTREQILLNLPVQVFCQEDCKGFCQKCGANRNLINCNCKENEVDPRWSKLKELK